VVARHRDKTRYRRMSSSANHQRVPSYVFARDETERRFILHLYEPQFIAELSHDGQIID
jgi:hypothetical protein